MPSTPIDIKSFPAPIPDFPKIDSFVKTSRKQTKLLVKHLESDLDNTERHAAFSFYNAHQGELRAMEYSLL